MLDVIKRLYSIGFGNFYLAVEYRTGVSAIRDATNKARVLEGDRFCEKIEILSGRRASQQARGCPRKDFTEAK